MLLVGYFENIATESGICSRCVDSFSLRDFLGLASHVSMPERTTVSRTRRRLPVEVFEEFFHLVSTIVAANGLLKGRVHGVNSTYLQADKSTCARAPARMTLGTSAVWPPTGMTADVDTAEASSRPRWRATTEEAMHQRPQLMVA